MRTAWLTDIHLNFASPVRMDSFLSKVRGCDADCILISGDIGEAPRLAWYLWQMANAWERPIYFVLGNHDFYKSSFDEVHAVVRKTLRETSHLSWLRDAGVVELTPQTAMIGHDSWADGRFGNYIDSPVIMNDYMFIRDLNRMDQVTRLSVLNALGDAAAEYVREWLPKALDNYPEVIFLTHVPPFREACWHMGSISNDNYLPHFACKAVGDELVDIMRRYPQRSLMVLCGHTHSAGRAQILDNLVVFTGGAEYGAPAIQQIIEIT